MLTSSITGNANEKPVILLDLNYTLVWNSQDTMSRRRYDEEIYRPWLIDLVQTFHVCLVTVRSIAEEQSTLDRIEAQSGWRPTEAHFNDRGLHAEEWKEQVLHTRILPRFEKFRLLAFESNAKVHKVYDVNGVPWAKIEKGDAPWPTIPTWKVLLSKR